MNPRDDLIGLLAGFVLAVVTTPVGVSGAVFLLPVQLSMLHVPSPRVTPTNLLYNVLAAPGGLARYRRRIDRGLALQLVTGSLPGVVIGVRRMATWTQDRTHLAFVVGVVGGLYGIGGGSLLGPLLVGAGMAVAAVAPAALFATWVTSLVGVATYAVLSLDAPGAVTADWSLVLAAGIGGLAGGWVGASLQPRLPERALRVLLGLLAVALSCLYLVQAFGCC